MIDQKIKIEASFIDDLDVAYKIYISNGEASSHINVYGYADTFKEFGEQLSSFPSKASDKVELELGNEDDTWAYHLSIKVFCYEPNGATAIEVKMNNKEVLPDLVKSVFYLTCMPSSINQLGTSLSGWNPEQKNNFNWSLPKE